MFPPPDYQLVMAHMAEMERLAADHRASRSARIAARGRIAAWLHALISSPDRRPRTAERPSAAPAGQGGTHLLADDVGPADHDDVSGRPLGAPRVIDLVGQPGGLDQQQPQPRPDGVGAEAGPRL